MHQGQKPIQLRNKGNQSEVRVTTGPIPKEINKIPQSGDMINTHCQPNVFDLHCVGIAAKPQITPPNNGGN